MLAAFVQKKLHRDWIALLTKEKKKIRFQKESSTRKKKERGKN
jgi:hypothetical protein